MNAQLATVQAQLRWVGDALIPADEEQGMPSASQAGVPDVLVPRALKARDDLLAPFVVALARLPAEPPADALAAVRALGEADFDLVSHIVAGAYFLNDDVNRRLKYPGQETLLYDPDYDEIMDVAQRIMDRGPIFVDPDKHRG